MSPTVPAPLPPFPTLRAGTPVLVRGPGEVQVGLDAGRAVVLDAPTARLLLPLLDGDCDLATVRAVSRSCGLPRPDVDRLLTTLQQHDLLEPPAPDGCVRVLGLGPLGQQVATLLLDAGLTVLGHDATLPDPPEVPGLHRLTHASGTAGRTVALTVLAAETAEVDRGAAEQLLRLDAPHLAVAGTATTVAVGPLVLPGRSACLRCADLDRRDLDPAWPDLLAQLVAVRPDRSRLLVEWAAAQAASQVLAVLGGQVPETVGATLELSSHDHLMRRRRWAVHAGCGCAWPRTTEWAS